MSDDEKSKGRKELDQEDSEMRTWYTAPRRRVLQAIGGVSAALVLTGGASASGMESDNQEDDEENDLGNEEDADDDKDDEHEKPNDADDMDEDGERDDADGDAFSRFEDQVTDGTYVIVEEVRLTTPGFVSIHIARPEEDIADVGFINTENGDPQNAAATIIGYSEFLEPGTYEDVKVPLFEDEELDAVSGEIDRLPEPAVLVSLAHEDSNDNEEWDFYDEGNEDPAYDFGDTMFAPPFDRPTDIAAVVPLEANEDEFEISR